MNYPLAEAILGYRGRLAPRHGRGPHATTSTRRRSCRLDGPAFAARLEELMDAYDAEVIAVQLNLLGSHDAPAPAHGARRRPARRPARDAAPDDAARRAVHLLRRRGRAGRRATTRTAAAAFPWDEDRWDARPAPLRSRAAAPAPTLSRPPGGRRRRGRPTARRDRVRARRGERSGLVVAVNAGDEPIRLELALAGVADGAATRTDRPRGADGVGSDARSSPRRNRSPRTRSTPSGRCSASA